MIVTDTDQKPDFMLAALFAAGDIAYEWDLRTDRMRWSGNPQSLAEFGDIINIQSGSALTSRMTADDLMLRQQALETHFASRQPIDCEYGLRRGDGEFTWVHDRGAAEFEEGRPTRIIGILRQIDERKEREMKVGMSANYDLVSGQRSAEMLQELLANKISTALRAKSSGAFLYAGIDHMSDINMRYGQAVADRVLFEVGDRIQRALRGGDVMGRIHGDRFGIVLSNCTPAEMAMAAERLLRAVRDNPIALPDHSVLTMTVSIGGCNFPDYVRNVPEATRIAEEAMHRAKSAGRDCFVGYTPSEEDRASMKRADEVGQFVIQAIRNDNLVFAYQAICDSLTAEPVFYECLLRVRRADGTLAGAGDFIPDIERGGRMFVLDQRILEMAVVVLEECPGIRLAINISGITACEPDWIRRAEALLRYKPDVASRLTIEITETAVLRNITECARTISAAKDLGCLVALDDFGVANITYRELRALAVNLVKIDAMLVRGLHNNPVNYGAIQQLIRIAADYNVQTIAEGIEDIRELQLLQRMGVNYIQGYLFSKPEVERPWLKPIDENIARIAKTAQAQG